MKWVCDFETTTDTKDCRVWLWGAKQIGGPMFFHDTTISSFIEWCRCHCGDTVYFHNAKFDTEFIYYHLFTNGWKHIIDDKDKRKNTFTTLISDQGIYYSTRLYFTKYDYINIYDSYKILPFKVEKIAHDFGLEESKLDIDYDKYRPLGYEPTEHEIHYLYNDCDIIATVLKEIFELGLTEMTQGSDALKDFKNTIGGNKVFKRLFPVLPILVDGEIRKSYKGGWTFCNPKFQGKAVGAGMVLDVNSLYPYVLYNKPLPTGQPIKFQGRYEYDELYPLYTQRFICRFTVRDNHFPCVQLKNTLRFTPTEYLCSDDGNPIELTMTNVDLKLFLDHYDVEIIEYLDGWKFRASNNIFKGYIDKWMKVKQENKNTNRSLYIFAKLMLNALYGKFGLKPQVRSKYPYLKDDGSIGYHRGDEELRDPVYIPIATFTTAYAREITIRAAQSLHNRFLYADTDSLHILGDKVPDNLEVHPTKLGCWDLEKHFTRAKFLHAKCYIEESEGKIDATIAGLPENAKVEVTWKNFKPGATFKGKLIPSHVPGGIVLEPIDFTIKI